MPYASSGLMLPGWHFFLARLGSLVEGESPPQSKQSWRELQAIYVEHYHLHDVKLDHTPAGG